MSFANPAIGVITSNFNPKRRHPITGVVSAHNGADVANKSGTPIKAAHSGIATVGDQGNKLGGRWVVVTDGTVSTRYLHLSSQAVKNGTTVKAGQIIGYMGATGAATGVHLHFEVRVGGIPADPVTWLQSRGVILGAEPASTIDRKRKEQYSMIFRLGSTTGPKGHYLLVSGGRSVPISHATAKSAKKAGVPLVQLTPSTITRTGSLSSGLAP